MKKTEQNTRKLSWGNDFGLFEAIITDGDLVSASFCRHGSSRFEGFFLYGSREDGDFIREVRRALGELLRELAK